MPGRKRSAGGHAPFFLPGARTRIPSMLIRALFFSVSMASAPAFGLSCEPMSEPVVLSCEKGSCRFAFSVTFSGGEEYCERVPYEIVDLSKPEFEKLARAASACQPRLMDGAFEAVSVGSLAPNPAPEADPAFCKKGLRPVAASVAEARRIWQQQIIWEHNKREWGERWLRWRLGIVVIGGLSIAATVGLWLRRRKPRPQA
jgi:hypothetical protein